MSEVPATTGTDLHVGTEYGTFNLDGEPTSHIGGEPISRLLPVGNQGGIRASGELHSSRLVVLVLNGQHPHWPDVLDLTSAKLTYYGDARPDREYVTQPKGNVLLESAFRRARSPQTREQAPVFLVFQTTGRRRNVRFTGVAAPGHPSVPRFADLVAEWTGWPDSETRNLRATFTLLNIPVVRRRWIDALLEPDVSGLLPADTPDPWRNWVQHGTYQVVLSA